MNLNEYCMKQSYDVAAGILLFAFRCFDAFPYVFFDIANINFLYCKYIFLMLQRSVKKFPSDVQALATPYI
jgi:hypothetical protein